MRSSMSFQGKRELLIQVWPRSCLQKERPVFRRAKEWVRGPPGRRPRSVRDRLGAASAHRTLPRSSSVCECLSALNEAQQQEA